MAEDSLRSWLDEARPEADRLNEAVPSPPPWWDDDASDRPKGSHRWKLLWAFGVLPWLVVAGLAWERAPVNQPVPAPVPPPPRDTVDVDAGAPPPARSVPLAEQPAAPASQASLDPALGAAAALTVQDVLTGSDGENGLQRYVDLALPEAVIWVGDVAIVQVAAVVLEGVPGRWDAPRHARYAVPLRAGPMGPRVLGPPWALAGAPDITPESAHFVPFHDQVVAEAVGRALTEVGYSDAHVHQLGRDPSIPGVLQAEITAIAPGEASAREHALWLRDDETPTLFGALAPGRIPQ
ncbi:MAG: hypothetical protein ACRDZO_29085 [Egibacteraceae bacterium]